MPDGAAHGDPFGLPATKRGGGCWGVSPCVAASSAGIAGAIGGSGAGAGGRGFVAACRGGRALLLDTHPEDGRAPSPVSEGIVAGRAEDTGGRADGSREATDGVKGTAATAPGSIGPGGVGESTGGIPSTDGVLSSSGSRRGCVPRAGANPAPAAAARAAERGVGSVDIGPAPGGGPATVTDSATSAGKRPTRGEGCRREVDDRCLLGSRSLPPEPSDLRDRGGGRVCLGGERGGPAGPWGGSRGGPVAAPRLPALATLASLCKAGIMVRAVRRFPCLSVVGVRYVKVAAWCKLCGMVRCGRRLAGRRCLTAADGSSR